MQNLARTFRWTTLKALCVVAASSALLACSNPQPGPDKTLGGAVLGAGWGVGAGAVVGNQLNNSGPGMVVGAGLGAAQGLMGGAGLDITEGAILEQERTLAALKVQNLATARALDSVQGKLDRAATSDATGGVYQVFFDTDATNLRAGATANLEVLANSIKRDPKATKIYVVGHADDGGAPEYNDRLSEARARSVAGYLTASGISSDQVIVSSFGAKRPLVTNSTPEGRQLNRRVDVYIGR